MTWSGGNRPMYAPLDIWQGIACAIEHSAKFWALVDRSGDCWIWQGSFRSHGYGQFYIRGLGQHRANRIALILSNGPLGPGLDACHRCDNPPCVNPAHLFAGTRRDNMRDAKSKGRIATGDKLYPSSRQRFGVKPNTDRSFIRNGRPAPWAKIGAAVVADIMARWDRGERQIEIARALSLSHKHVHAIVRGRLWKHVTKVAA